MNPRRSRQIHIDSIERHRAQINAQFEKHRAQINQRFDRQRERAEKIINSRQTDIIKAALELLNEKGLNELSLRDIAKKLHLQASALYWYFESKEALIDYMAEAILSKEFDEIAPRTDDQTWQAWLINLCKRLREAMLAYPDGGRVVTGAHLYPAVTLAKIFEVSMATLTEAGLEQDYTETVILTAVHFTFGRVIEEQSGPEPNPDFWVESQFEQSLQLIIH